MAFCTKCGHKLEDASYFCEECGYSTRRKAAAAPPVSHDTRDGRFRPAATPVSRRVVIGALAFVVLTIAGSFAAYLLTRPEEASEAVVLRAVQQYVNSDSAYAKTLGCLTNFDYAADPVAINGFDEQTKGWMEVLVSGGLYVAPEQQARGWIMPQLVYRKTPAGIKATAERALCFADGVVAKSATILAPPTPYGDTMKLTATVNYEWKSPAPWSQSEQARALVPQLGLQPSKEAELVLDKDRKWTYLTPAIRQAARRVEEQRVRVERASSPNAAFSSGASSWLAKLSSFFSGNPLLGRWHGRRKLPFPGGYTPVDIEFTATTMRLENDEIPVRYEIRDKTVVVEGTGFGEGPTRFVVVDADTIRVDNPFLAAVLKRVR